MRRALVLAVAMALVAGCSSATGPTSAPSTPTPPERSPAAVIDKRLPEPTWPLTGLPAPDREGGALIAVKVENSRPARPQTGLEAADVVFVELVEGGQTRFNALFNSVVPEVVGPVRSVRPMDAAILGQWRAALVFSGGQPQFVARVRDAGVQLMEEGDERQDWGFYRSRNRRSPHNLYVELPVAVSRIEPEHAEPPTAMFEYGEPASSAGGAEAASLRADYGSVRSGWEWDPASGRWFRFDDGVASTTADATTQLSAANVLVLRVNTRDTGARDSTGAWVPETILTGSGPLVLFSGGRMVEGTWSKGGDNDPFAFTDAAGAPLKLAAGNTWVELLPTQGTLTTG